MDRWKHWCNQHAGVTANELKNFYTGESLQLSLNKNEENLTAQMGLLFHQRSLNRKCNSIHQSHVTFYFRPEVHMVSEEGLNAYGAVTWGQFFIYQGFNEHCGWMHTSSV